MRITEQLRLLRNRISEAEATRDDVLKTETLSLRISRAPDFRAEADAIAVLAQSLSAVQESVLRAICETALTLCAAHSAGFSLLETEDGESLFRWHTVVGAMMPHTGRITPRDDGPCGIATERDAPQLFVRPERHYPYLRDLGVPLEELLVAPVSGNGEPEGALWVARGMEEGPFEAEDARLLSRLSTLAAASRKLCLNQQAAIAAQEQTEGEEAAKRLFFEITAAMEVPFAEKVQRILRLGCSSLHLENGIFARVEGDRYIVEQIQEPGHFGILPGAVFDLKDSYSERTLLTTWPIGFERASDDSREAHPSFRTYTIEAYLGTAIRVSDQVYGTLNFSSLTPRETPFTSGEREWVQMAARWIGHELEQRKSAEERERQARLFDTVLSSIVDFVYTFDRQGRFTYINQALLDLLRLTPEEALGKTFFELPYPHDLAARLHEQIQSVFETQTVLRDDTPYTDVTGHTGYYEYIFVPVFNAEGQVEAVAGSTRNITERHQEQAEKEALFKSLEVERSRLTDLFMQAPAFIAVLRGPDHVFELANLPFYETVGQRELLGKTVRDALPELAGQGFFELLDRVYRTGEPFIGKEMTISFQESRDAPPRTRFVDFIYQPQREADGSISGIVVHGVDLTDRKTAEKERAQREEEITALNRRLRLAIRETHHRVKNNLQVISAMVEMQMLEFQGAEMVPVEELARLHAHIHTLSVVHELLTRNAQDTDEGQILAAKSVLDRLLPMLQRTAWKKQVHYQIEDAELTAKQCIALSLVLTELVSNALKHGRERAEVRFRTDDSDGHLIVSDDGSGFPANFDPIARANTGLELVTTLVSTDLGGEITYGNDPDGGGRVAVQFPLPRP